ncbi:MAG: DUF177 domain-containing protein [Candidatus Marinimicrobia bacterium]|nr:DUF177 domain-containing protein [Candidatus Neomarinimicrobiota bacterium]
MKIRLKSLKEGHQILEYSSSRSDLNLTDNYFNSPIIVTLSINKGSTEISINGEIQTILDLECDRCLSLFQQTLKSSFKIILSQIDIDAMNCDENIISFSSNTSEVDILPQIRDALILNIPLKKLCRKSCKGLCPKCGANLNIEKCKCDTTSIDPRWEPLKNVLINIKEE